MFFAILFVLAVPEAPELVDVEKLDKSFVLDIRYATDDNFFGKKVYAEGRCLLRTKPAEMLVAAQRWLDKHHPGTRLMLKDCYRPASVQFVLWDAVKGTPKSAYVANPNGKTGSIHSYGAAVDLTLVDDKGVELDMGTPYDFLGKRAEPRHEEKFLASGELTKLHLSNRKILRSAMKEAGWRAIPNEWWHFDEAKKEEVRERYQKLDIPFSSVPR